MITPHTIGLFRGPEITPWLDDVARLRLAVFRDWPYLYEGAPSYEETYLAAYADSPGAAVIAAIDGDRAVGCATCQPMTEANARVQAAFRGRGLDPARYCYYGESVLLPDSRAAAPASASSNCARPMRARSA